MMGYTIYAKESFEGFELVSRFWGKHIHTLTRAQTHLHLISLTAAK